MRPNEILIGKGDLTWSRYERISDRYALCTCLTKAADSSNFGNRRKVSAGKLSPVYFNRKQAVILAIGQGGFHLRLPIMAMHLF